MTLLPRRQNNKKTRKTSTTKTRPHQTLQGLQVYLRSKLTYSWWSLPNVMGRPMTNTMLTHIRQTATQTPRNGTTQPTQCTSSSSVRHHPIMNEVSRPGESSVTLFQLEEPDIQMMIHILRDGELLPDKSYFESKCSQNLLVTIADSKSSTKFSTKSILFNQVKLQVSRLSCRTT